MSLFAFSQADKDSLFAKNVGDIYDTLKVMHHLEEAAFDYYRISEEERSATEQVFAYYLKKNVITTNPVPSIDILHYLEIYLQKDIPNNWKSFMIKVNNTNAKMLLVLTDKYGYPSKERLDKFTGINSDIHVINFAVRPNDYLYALKKMLRKENKKGNVSDDELEIFTMFGGKGTLSSKDIVKMKNRKMKFIIPD